MDTVPVPFALGNFSQEHLAGRVRLQRDAGVVLGRCIAPVATDKQRSGLVKPKKIRTKFKEGKGDAVLANGMEELR